MSMIKQNIRQNGFTLIELLVALAIFAMLAVAGWQIMDSITKSRDRANLQLGKLSELQYAYLQLSQDFAQTSNYVSVPAGISAVESGTGNTALPIKATFVVTPQVVDFMRLASPDPRLNPPPALAHIVYAIDNGKLVKQRFYQSNNPNETPNTSVILSDISDAKWTAFTPKLVDNFPDAETLQNAQNAQNGQTAQPAQSATTTNPTPVASPAQPTANAVKTLDLTPYQQLPKGVQLSFRYHGEPVVWRFALPSQAPNFSLKTTIANAGG